MTSAPLLIYVQKLTPRVEYIFSTLLEAIGIHSIKFTPDREHFTFNTGAKINYSSVRITAEECWTKPIALLFQKDIVAQPIDSFEWNGTRAFFKVDEGDFPFDVFAAAFYLMSRYEEYLPHTEDMYGRYAHENSLAYRERFLHLPVVNKWLTELEHLLRSKFPDLPPNPTAFHFLPTYDIDIAWSYLCKGAFRNAGGFLKSMIHGEWTAVKERAGVLFKKKADPFDSYKWLHRLHKEHRLKPLYFFLLASSNRKYDRNILPARSAMQRLIKEHDHRYLAGIHPSWHSGDKPRHLKKEIEVLKILTGKKVNKSRQHYIRMNLPITYRRLIDAGITEDYSMGYGSINGFRASYCLPYQWYDLQKEEMTPLTIYPFCYMDANSFYEQHLSADEALQEMLHYCEVVKDVKGLFISIWHNHFLGTDKMFEGWKEAYAAAVEKISGSSA